jgi:hypothetical protein
MQQTASEQPHRLRIIEIMTLLIDIQAGFVNPFLAIPGLPDRLPQKEPPLFPENANICEANPRGEAKPALVAAMGGYGQDDGQNVCFLLSPADCQKSMLISGLKSILINGLNSWDQI